MEIRLKPIREQAIVVTGASSGIGLATAREAARRGARVVLAARNGTALRHAVEEIRARGGSAVSFEADVSDAAQVNALADFAVERYGGFDTWVNNAGVSIYGRLEDIVIEDARRLFDVDYWGTVYGSLAALPQLRAAGGALINVGSALPERGLPLQGHYAAAKEAVRAFTDALRLELAREEAPVSVTLVRPASIDTPITRHARNLLEHEPRLPAPAYRPEVAARAILHCARHPRRSVTVGATGRALTLGMLAPGTSDRRAARALFEGQEGADVPRVPRRDSLYQPPMDWGSMRGSYPGRVRRGSAYTGASLHPGRTLLGLGMLGALAWALAPAPAEHET